MGSSFSILRFPDQELPDLVYLEHLTNAVYLDKRPEVERYLDVMELLCDQSEPPARTEAFINKVLSEL